MPEVIVAYYMSIGLLILPLLLNFLVIFWVMRLELKLSPAFVQWVQENSSVTAGAIILASKNIEAFLILSSYILQLDCFSADLTPAAEFRLRKQAFFSTFVESVPQLALQIYVAIMLGWDLITTLSVISGLILLVFTTMRRLIQMMAVRVVAIGKRRRASAGLYNAAAATTPARGPDGVLSTQLDLVAGWDFSDSIMMMSPGEAGTTPSSSRPTAPPRPASRPTSMIIMTPVGPSGETPFGNRAIYERRRQRAGTTPKTVIGGTSSTASALQRSAVIARDDNEDDDDDDNEDDDDDDDEDGDTFTALADRSDPDNGDGQLPPAYYLHAFADWDSRNGDQPQPNRPDQPVARPSHRQLNALRDQGRTRSKDYGANSASLSRV